MINKPPFSTAKKLIETDNIHDLTELLETVPKTNLANAMKTSPKRFNRLIDNPTLFMIADIYNLADVLGIEEMKMLSIIHSECIKRKK